MTVIVWDGKTLAADKRATQSDLARTVTKIRRIRGHLCAISGDWDLAQEQFLWFAEGADPHNLPPYFRNKEDWVSLTVITPNRRVWKYERSPYPIDYTESVRKEGFIAFGSGRDFAVGALSMGADARTAVKVAIMHCPTCGNGVDTLTLKKETK